MRVFLTGGTGFIGSAIAKQLRERGDDVVAFVRSEARATALQGLGCELVQGDVTNAFTIERSLQKVDAVIHLAGRWEIGIVKPECPKMQDVNIGGVRHLLEATANAEIPRVIYASTVAVFGNTNGEIVDENYSRNTAEGFMSCYDESKYRAHMLVLDRINKGAPIVVVQPCAVLGERDHSEPGRQIMMAARGQLRAIMLAQVGLTFAYVDDIAKGFLQALDKGKIGESYILGGESVRLIDAMAKAAELAGQRLPSRTISPGFLKAIAPFSQWIAPRFGYPPNIKEVVRSSDGVTYWAKDDKARNELGYTSRPLEETLRDTLTGAGVRLVAS